jgi:hypothetical protein
MERRASAKGLIEGLRIHRRDPGRVVVADPPPQLQGCGERPLEGHLLIELESDQEGKGVVDEQAVGLFVAGEVEPLRAAGGDGHGPDGTPEG